MDSSSRKDGGPLQAGAMLGAYRIERQLGRGGMGAVFLAYDTTLHRRVAIKVIHEPDRSETSHARLLREARNAAALNHPNICTVYEVGEADGCAFIAMEYVEGLPLSDRVAKAALPFAEAVQSGIEAADALAYAHEHGVIHRDLKAANAIGTRAGRLKLVDFGLARREDVQLGDVSTMASLAPAGVAVGTPYAMAPEQVRGGSTDARTDIWALGVLLYEMVAGAKPFSAPAVPELFSSILRDPPAPLTANVPVEMRALIERCLDKEPGRRYQTASDVRDALDAVKTGAVPTWVTWRYRFRRRRWLVPSALILGAGAILALLNVGGMRDRLVGRRPKPAMIKLAVLPFENLTGDPEQEYFSDGLTEEMITQLGRLQPQRLSVIARTSSMRYKKSATPIDQIGRELGVDYVLEGSARREEARVRISATLVQVRDQTQQWSDSFERELAGILSLQSDVARGVARSLALQLLPAEQARLASTRPVNPEAYEAYLKGEVHLWKLTPQALDTAQEYFELALQKDPNDALARLGIGTVWLARSNIGDLPPEQGWPKQQAAALEILKLDETLAEAHNQLGAVLAWYQWNWPEADREFRRAIELDPNTAEVRRNYSLFLASTGRRDEALMEIRRALELDPHNPLWRLNYGLMLFALGREDDAVAIWQKLLKTDPDFTLTHGFLWDAFHRRRLHREAIAEARMFHAGRGDEETAEALARGYAEGGYQRAMHQAAELMAARFTRRYVHPTAIARLYTYAGEKGRALDWLERAYDGRDSQLMYLRWHMEWDSLRAETRLQALLRRMKLPL